MSPSPVAVVLDPNFGEDLEHLALDYAVWITPSPVNTPVVQRIWSTAKPYTSDGPGVTLWSQPRTGDSREEWEGILEDIENHHGSPSQEPPFTSLKVIGAKLDENARAALLAYGYKQLSETSTGFEASPGTSV